MKNRKKLKLEDLRVNSFITSLNDSDKATVNGGSTVACQYGDNYGTTTEYNVPSPPTTTCPPLQTNLCYETNNVGCPATQAQGCVYGL